MRRSLFAGIGVAAVLVLAACTDRAQERAPLIPTQPSLAQSPQCANNFANQIENQIDALFTDPVERADLQAQFANIQDLCPAAVPELMNYLNSVATYGAPSVGNPTDSATAQALVNHWSALVRYVKDSVKTWPAGVLMGDGVVAGVADGGAAVLGPNGYMETYDGQAGLTLPGSLPAGGPFLFTFLQVPVGLCDAGTSLRLNGRCYDVSDYPDGGTYNPTATIHLCLHETSDPDAIGHAKNQFGTEVLPDASTPLTFSCAHDHETVLASWLGRQGPLGRMLAKGYNYLAPKTLFADDVGESGSIGSFSLVGGILNEILKDDFEEFNATGLVGPDVGDVWTLQTFSPGYIVINQAGYPDLPGPVVELSQAQGNCQNCPVFRLFASRENSGQSETVGSYDVEWQSRQNKPSVKEAPFVILNSLATSNNTNNEIARVSYTTVSSQNRIVFRVRRTGSLPDSVVDAGPWTKETAQSFKVRVNLNVLNDALDNTVSLYIGGNPVAGAQNIKTLRAFSLLQIGYHLTGIDAGIIASDNWKVTRLADVP